MVWIPGRLAFCMLRSNDLLYAVNAGLLKAGGMLPPGAGPETAAAVWVGLGPRSEEASLGGEERRRGEWEG